MSGYISTGEDEGFDDEQDRPRRRRRSGMGGIGMLFAFQFKSSVDSALSSVDLVVNAWEDLHQELAKANVTLPGKYSPLSECKMSVAADNATISDSVSLDATDINTLCKSLAVNHLRPLGSTLDSFLVSQARMVGLNLDALLNQSSREFMDMLQLDEQTTSMFLMFNSQLTAAKNKLATLVAS